MNIDNLRDIASGIREEFEGELDFTYKAIRELPNCLNSWGECDDEGVIRVRLKVYKRNRELARSTVVKTLCHEMAHLRHFNHGKKFLALEKRLIKWCRVRGLLKESTA